MNWFEILKNDDLLKGLESPFWLERKAELDAMGVKLIEEGEPQTEFIGSGYHTHQRNRVDLGK